MAHTHASDQPRERVCVKDIANHAIGLALEEATLGTTGNDTAGILAAVLEERKTLADLVRDVDRGVMGEQAEDATHWSGLEYMHITVIARRSYSLPCSGVLLRGEREQRGTEIAGRLCQCI